MRGFVRIFVSVSVVLSFVLSGCAVQSECIRNAEQDKAVIFEEDFESGFDGWWCEGSDKVYVEDGRLYIEANGGETRKEGFSTVWCKTPIAAENVHVEFDAYVIESREKVNNVNFFLNYSRPDSRGIFETREERLDGEYTNYHNLNGYIFTYLKEQNAKPEPGDEFAKARVRIRRCPGFKLIKENFAYNAEAKKKRQIEIIKRENRLTFKVDGKTLSEISDPNPWDEGYFGLRTYMTSLWVDNIRVTEIR